MLSRVAKVCLFAIRLEVDLSQHILKLIEAASGQLVDAVKLFEAGLALIAIIENGKAV